MAREGELTSERVSWQRLADDNPENRVAGNVDDLVKHTVYLTLLSWLRERAPWQRHSFIHECHAGRGVYEVGAGDRRRALLDRLGDGLLGKAQRHALKLVNAYPAASYAGSALLCAAASPPSSGHRYEGYEWDPSTRAILRAVLAEAGHASECVLGDEGTARFDGESHIAAAIAAWGPQDVVLLDPFAVWDRDKHMERRARYLRIFDALRTHAAPPVWTLYFTWRHVEAVSNPCPGGYRDLRARLAWPIVEGRWQSEVPCALWVAAPAPHAEALCHALRTATDALQMALGVPAVAWQVIAPSAASRGPRELATQR